jgi:hypothetical protein
LKTTKQTINHAAWIVGNAGKLFSLIEEWDGQRADCTLSLDVIYHLVEDKVYHDYMTKLFEWAQIFVVIYSSNFNSGNWGGHVRHREFTTWIRDNAKDFSLVHKEKNPYSLDRGRDKTRTSAGFFVYKRNSRIILRPH